MDSWGSWKGENVQFISYHELKHCLQCPIGLQCFYELLPLSLFRLLPVSGKQQ